MMNNVTIGEIIELDNGKKYLCFDQIKENEYSKWNKIWIGGRRFEYCKS